MSDVNCLYYREKNKCIVDDGGSPECIAEECHHWKNLKIKKMRDDSIRDKDLILKYGNEIIELKLENGRLLIKIHELENKIIELKLERDKNPIEFIRLKKEIKKLKGLNDELKTIQKKRIRTFNIPDSIIKKQTKDYLRDENKL